jgi:GNAT superfamily N-acetyltransferase
MAFDPRSVPGASQGQGVAVIRRIEAGEGHILRQLRLQSLVDAPDAFGQPLEEAAALPDAEWSQIARATADGDHRAWLIAFDGLDPVGLVQGRRRRPGTLLLFSMWVAPEARHRAIGSRLIESLEDWARGWHATETVLWVLRANEGAMSFYRRLGFESLLDGPDAASGAEHGALAMRREIRAR